MKKFAANQRAALDYEISPSDKVMDMKHTFVPFKHRGKGHAEMLVEAWHSPP